MKEALVDVSVLLIFFTRYELFQQVFEQVRKARPSEIFLYQDGPRENHPDDIENIRKCRKIAENIDWECKVHKLYQKRNLGVDPSGYLADSWVFSLTDKCIVLEDDAVPAVSFFSFCKMMLDKYEDDERIMLISGLNIEEETTGIDSSYFFSVTTFMSGGWATWSRVVNQWDTKYLFLKDVEKRKQVEAYIKEKGLVKNMLNVFQEHLDSGVEHFETLLISNQYLHRGLTVVPVKNMVSNIGVGEGSAHYVESIATMPKGLRQIFTMRYHEMDLQSIQFPEVVEDYLPYKKHSYRIFAWGHPIIKAYRYLEGCFYKIIRGNIKGAIQDIQGAIYNVMKKTFS